MMTFLAVLLAAGAVQDKGKKPGAQEFGVDSRRVDEAIRKGIAFLKTAGAPGYQGSLDFSNCDELVFLTFIHAGVPETDPKFQELLKRVLGAPLERTYKVSLLAMALEELDRVKYQKRIAQCAQFLVDNQNANGQWGYGTPTEFLTDVPTASPFKAATPTQDRKAAGRGAPLARPAKPPVKAKILILQKRTGTMRGDNSNSQYAALGLRACHDAGIVLPKEVVARAEKWWRDSQEKTPKESRDVATGGAVTAPPAGWGYDERGEPGEGPRGSMTAGAVGSLCIYGYIQGKPWMKDPSVLGGLAWMGKHFTVTANPCYKQFHYYYLYALERAGILYDTDRIGSHEWYPEGAAFLLRAQKPDGSWADPAEEYFAAQEPVWSTCYAILFLKRATRPLRDVASVDRFHAKPPQEPDEK